MVKTYTVEIICRVDSMRDEKSIDIAVSKHLKMFKGFYKGKKSNITKNVFSPDVLFLRLRTMIEGSTGSDGVFKWVGEIPEV